MQTVKQSFTLVEILVVIVIIGILSSFIFFTINDSVEKASIAKSKMFSESIRNNLLLNLVAEWKLDGNARDSWGSYHGTWYGIEYLDESLCVDGKCAYFDGSYNDYITIPAITSLTTGKPFMISAWIYPELTGTYRTVVGYDSDHRLLAYDGYMLSQQGANLYSGSDTIFEEKWNHIVYWFSGTEEGWYVNGESTNPLAYTLAEWNGAFMIGQYNLAYYPFKGRIDTIEIYDNVMDSETIMDLYLSKSIEIGAKINNHE